MPCPPFNLCPQPVQMTKLYAETHLPQGLDRNTATLPLVSMHAMGGRRVRPRQVNYNERLPLVHLYDEEEDIDASLKAFLETQEEERMLMKALEAGTPRPQKGGKKQVGEGGRP